jgi:hypothetical protein
MQTIPAGTRFEIGTVTLVQNAWIGFRVVAVRIVFDTGFVWELGMDFATVGRMVL